MITALLPRALVLAIVAPTVALLPLVTSPRMQAAAQAQLSALHARSDAKLDAPSPFGALERAELAAAEQHGAALPALRGGFAPSDNEWKWLAIGAGIVLLIVLL